MEMFWYWLTQIHLENGCKNGERVLEPNLPVWQYSVSQLATRTTTVYTFLMTRKVKMVLH